MRPVCVPAILLTIAAILCLAGCDNGGGGGNQDAPAVATLTTPEGVQQGNITISYTLKDKNGNPSDIVVQYSKDGGATWKPATGAAGGNGTENLETSKAGVSHTFIWDSIADLVAIHSIENNVCVKIIPFSKTIGIEGTTKDFTVDNTESPVNLPPSVLVTTPALVQTGGNFPISYKLYDMENNNCGIYVEYAFDNSGWHDATPGTGGDGTTGLAASSDGVSHVFYWDSYADNVARMDAEDLVRIMITPYDTQNGSASATDIFMVDNSKGFPAQATPSRLHTPNPAAPANNTSSPHGATKAQESTRSPHPKTQPTPRR
jgi:hypothetical protein